MSTGAALGASLAARTVVLGVAWAILSEADGRSPLLAAAVVAVAVIASFWLVPPGALRVRPAGLLRFVPFFLKESALGGLDVARRALDPRHSVQPILVDHPLRVSGAARTAFVAVASLLPGTLSAELLEDRLRIHVLDRSIGHEATLAELEARVADLFDQRGEARQA